MAVAGAADGQTVTVYLATGDEIWLRGAAEIIAATIAVAVLVAACLLARWRFTRRDAAPARRISRILWTSLAGAGGLTLILMPIKLRWGGFAAETLILDFMLRSIVALALFGVADLLLDFFRPRRNLAWLCVAPPLLASFVFMIVAASTWADAVDAGQAGPVPLAAAVAAALVWWSFLPVADLGGASRRIASIFK